MTRKKLWCILALVMVMFTVFDILWLSAILNHDLPKDQLFNSAKSPGRVEKVHPFISSSNNDTYIYSAIVEATAALELSKADVVVTAFDRSRESLICCVLVDNDNVTAYLTLARPYFSDIFGNKSIPSIYFAKQYRCSPTWPNHKPRYVTLTSSACSSNIKDYIPVIYARMQPGKLAICTKAAFSQGLDAQKLVEWFEMQIILGVDKIVIYNLGVDKNITKIFHHYENLGLLQTLPYELPGEPKNRTLSEALRTTPQFYHDETLALLECKLRMSGYDFVLSHDLDEMVIPRENVLLKQLFKTSLTNHPKAAGFYFYTAFYIFDWAKTNPEEFLFVKSYRMSSGPRWDRYKFVIIPNRTWTMITHNVYAKEEYTVPTLKASDVILHHYRKCWKITCFVPMGTDDVMTRYSDRDARVINVLKHTLK